MSEDTKQPASGQQSEQTLSRVILMGINAGTKEPQAVALSAETGAVLLDSGVTSVTAGSGLSNSGTSAAPILDVNTDGSTLEISTDTLRVKDAGITAAKLATSVAGDGLAGGGGTALSVNVDASTIEINADTLRVKDAGITAAKIAASVAGNGLAGGAGSALSVNVDNATLEISADTLQVKNSGIQYANIAAGAVYLDSLESRARPVQNMLINGGFDFAQRQTPGTDTTIADAAYSADRWKILRENADLQYSRQDATSESGLTARYYGKFTKITNAGKIAFYQILEGINTLPLRGRSTIFQAKIKSNTSRTLRMGVFELQSGGTMDTVPSLFSSMASADSTDPTKGSNIAALSATAASGAQGTVSSTPGNSALNCSVTTSWQTFGLVVTPSTTTNCKNLIFAIWSDADIATSGTVSIAEAGVYDGQTLRDWLPRPTAQEFDLCCRYFEAMGGDSSTEYFAMVWAYSGTSAEGLLNYRVEKHKVPTITNTGNFKLWSAAAGILPVTSLSFNSLSKRGATAAPGASGGGMVGGNASVLSADASTSTRIYIDAEL